MSLTVDLIRRVRPAVEARIRRTPVVETAWRGQRQFWKLECRQITGSFKVRGPLAFRAEQTSARPWVTASAGNHGLGVAYAAQGGPSPHVFVSRHAPQVKREAIAQWGATLHLCDTEGYDATEAEALAWADQENACFVSAFDDDIIMAGNGGTLAWEILEQLPQVDTVVVPVGGGGLSSGVGCLMRSLAPHVRLIGVQSEETNAMSTSWRTGVAVLEQSSTQTLAEGLEGGVCERTFAYVQRWFDDVLTVDEEAIARGMSWAWHTLGQRIEGSAAVVVAALHERSLPPSAAVCGVLSGSNVDDAVLQRVLQQTEKPPS